MKKVLIILVIIFGIIGAAYLTFFFGLDIKNQNSTVEYGLKEENFKHDVTIFNKKIKFKTKLSDNFSLMTLGKHKIQISINFSVFELKKITKEITIVDTNKPTINLLGEKSLTIIKGEEYKEEGFYAEDVIDGNLTDKVKVNNNVDTKTAGKYEITYKVADANNNVTTVIRTVNVISKEAVVPNTSIDATELTYINGVLLVNKKYGLPSSYAPYNNKEAENYLALLRSDAAKVGYTYKYNCGYRSYNDQRIIYNGYVRDYGQEQADTFSAQPGHSEHQTGLAFDIGEFSEGFGSTNEGKWLAENAHKYGFIIRYPKGKENITGYSYEPWHIRYLGIEIATKVYESGLTLEEYLGV